MAFFFFLFFWLQEFSFFFSPCYLIMTVISLHIFTFLFFLLHI
jgi:hypothetical protein